jgi:GNAT superfamily N-acetyltransferase
MKPRFRLATISDCELLLDLMSEYYAFDGHRYDRDKARTALAALLQNPLFGLAWLILDGDTPAGYAVLCFGYSLEYLGRDAFVDEFYLRESYRGKGWGLATMEFVEQQARLQGVRTLHLEVVRKNSEALTFYRKFGFHDHDHYMMSKKIEGTSSRLSPARSQVSGPGI